MSNFLLVTNFLPSENLSVRSDSKAKDSESFIIWNRNRKGFCFAEELLGFSPNIGNNYISSLGKHENSSIELWKPILLSAQVPFWGKSLFTRSCLWICMCIQVNVHPLSTAEQRKRSKRDFTSSVVLPCQLLTTINCNSDRSNCWGTFFCFPDIGTWS